MDVVLSKTDLSKIFKWDSVYHDNILFKLHHQVNFFVILFGVVFIFGENYLNGKAIVCVGADSYSAQYCWLHGTGHIPDDLAKAIKEPCGNGDGDNDDNEMHYYIWLPFVLIICLVLVKLPRAIWKSCLERGLMEGLTSSDLIPEKIVAKIKKAGADGRSAFSKLKAYHYGFVFCEVLNMLVVLINFSILDSLLNNKFFQYGSNVMDWRANKHIYLGNKGLGKVNPMCNLFPTEVGCNIAKGSVVGLPQKENLLCILSNNLFNQYFFLILWTWWVILLSLSCLGLVYRTAQVLVPSFSRVVLRNYLMSTGYDEVVDKISPGSLNPSLCFLLGRLSVNMKGSRISSVLEELTFQMPGNKELRQEDGSDGELSHNNIPLVEKEK